MSDELPEFSAAEDEASLSVQSTDANSLKDLLKIRGYVELNRVDEFSTRWAKDLGHGCSARVLFSDDGGVTVFRLTADYDVVRVGDMLPRNPTVASFMEQVVKAEKLEESAELPEFSDAEDEASLDAGLNVSRATIAITILRERGYYRLGAFGGPNEKVTYAKEREANTDRVIVSLDPRNDAIDIGIENYGRAFMLNLSDFSVEKYKEYLDVVEGGVDVVNDYLDIDYIDEAKELPEFSDAEDEASLSVRPVDDNSLKDLLKIRGYVEFPENALYSWWGKDLGSGCWTRVGFGSDGFIRVYRMLSDRYIRSVGTMMRNPSFDEFARLVSKAEKLNEAKELPDFPEEDDIELSSASHETTLGNLLKIRGYQQDYASTNPTTISMAWRKVFGRPGKAFSVVVYVMDSFFRAELSGEYNMIHTTGNLYKHQDNIISYVARVVERLNDFEQRAQELADAPDDRTTVLPNRGWTKVEHGSSEGEKWTKKLSTRIEIAAILMAEYTLFQVFVDGARMYESADYACTEKHFKSVLANEEKRALRLVSESAELPELSAADDDASLDSGIAGESVESVLIDNGFRPYIELNSESTAKRWTKLLTNGVTVRVTITSDKACYVRALLINGETVSSARAFLVSPAKMQSLLSYVTKYDDRVEEAEAMSDVPDELSELTNEPISVDVLLRARGYTQFKSNDLVWWTKRVASGVKAYVYIIPKHAAIVEQRCRGGALTYYANVYPVTAEGLVPFLKHAENANINEAEEQQGLPDAADDETLSRVLGEKPEADSDRRIEPFVNLACNKFGYTAKDNALSVVLEKSWLTSGLFVYNNRITFEEDKIHNWGLNSNGFGEAIIPLDIPSLRYMLSKVDAEAERVITANGERIVTAGGVAVQLPAIERWLEEEGYMLLRNEAHGKSEYQVRGQSIFQHWVKKFSNECCLELELGVSNTYTFMRKRNGSPREKCALDLKRVMVFVSSWEQVVKAQAESISEAAELNELPEEDDASLQTGLETSTEDMLREIMVRHGYKFNKRAGDWRKDVTGGANCNVFFNMGVVTGYVHYPDWRVFTDAAHISLSNVESLLKRMDAAATKKYAKVREALEEFPDDDATLDATFDAAFNDTFKALFLKRGYHQVANDWVKRYKTPNSDIFISVTLFKENAYTDVRVNGALRYVNRCVPKMPSELEKELAKAEAWVQENCPGLLKEDEQQEFPYNYQELMPPEIPDNDFANEFLGRFRDRRIKIAYATYTPESIENGDAEDRGWEDEEGVEFDEDFEESYAEGIRSVVRFLQNKGASDSFVNGGREGTYTTEMYVTDYGTGEQREETFFLHNFNEIEIEDIYLVMTGKKTINAVEDEQDGIFN